MKILIDINHPAHVHYFKNLIKVLKSKGHEFLIISRNKEIEHDLLKHYGISFMDRGKGEHGKFGKIIYLFKAIFTILKQMNIVKPDIIISFGTPYPAISGWLFGIPHVSINDTEHAKMHHLLTDPFSECILTPSCYKKNLGKKQIRFDGYMELCYLHPNYFKPNPAVLKYLGVKRNEKYVIMRFVSWNAVHDEGHSGLSIETKIEAVKELAKYAKVFISSEEDLPEELVEYQINIPFEKMHDALAFASLLYGESSTMASECACLGTPAIYHDNDGRGYTEEEEKKYGLVFNYSESTEDQQKSLKKAIEIIKLSNQKDIFVSRSQKMLSEKIDVTAFLIWFIENYPRSHKVMQKDPYFQNNFL